MTSSFLFYLISFILFLFHYLYLSVFLSVYDLSLHPPLSVSLSSISLSSQAETIRLALPFLAEVHSPLEPGDAPFICPSTHALSSHTGRKPPTPTVRGRGGRKEER